MQIGFVCLVAPAFGGGVWALGFLRGATRRKIPEPPCRGKRDLRAALRVAGFRPLIVAVGCESPVRNFANWQLASWWDRGRVQTPPRPTTGADEERRARSSPQKCYLVCKSVRIGLVVCKTFTRVVAPGPCVAGFSPRHTHFFAPSFPPHQHFLAPSFPPN